MNLKFICITLCATSIFIASNAYGQNLLKGTPSAGQTITPIYQSGANMGIGTLAPTRLLDVFGTVNNNPLISAYNSSAATTAIGVSGYANGGMGVIGDGGNNGIGVRGNSFAGTAVDGVSSSGKGVMGSAHTGHGVWGHSNSGVGVRASSNSGIALLTNGNIAFQSLVLNNTLSRILTTDALGNVAWRDASTLGGADHLGNHTATKNLIMSNFGIDRAKYLNFFAGASINDNAGGLTVNSTGVLFNSAVNVTGNLTNNALALAGGGSGLVTSSATGVLTRLGNGTAGQVLTQTTPGVLGWTTMAGDNLGNHTATKNLAMSCFGVDKAKYVNFCSGATAQDNATGGLTVNSKGILFNSAMNVTGNITNNTLAGVGFGLVTANATGVVSRLGNGTAGQVLTQTAAGALAWTAVAGDNLGNHTATKNLAMSCFAIDKAKQLSFCTGAVIQDNGAAGLMMTSNGVTRGEYLFIDLTGKIISKPAVAGSNPWILGGNAVAGVQNIGTTTNFDFPIMTANTQRMIVRAGGDVDILGRDRNFTVGDFNPTASSLRIFATDMGTMGGYAHIQATPTSSNLINPDGAIRIDQIKSSPEQPIAVSAVEAVTDRVVFTNTNAGDLINVRGTKMGIMTPLDGTPTARLEVQCNPRLLAESIRFREIPSGCGDQLVIDNNGFVKRAAGTWTCGNGTITAEDDKGEKGGVGGIREPNAAQAQEIQQLKTENQSLRERLDRIEKMLSMNPTSVAPAKTEVKLTSNPNPAKDYVMIHYEMPKTYSDATLIITDWTGKEVNRFQLSDCCGELNMDINSFSSGTYLHTLIHQNKVLATQKMVITK